MLHLLLRSRSRSLCTTCVGMTMMSLHCLMHMMYPPARGPRGGGEEEECCPRLLPQLRQRKCIRNQTLPPSRALYLPLSLSFMEVILAPIRKARLGYMHTVIIGYCDCDWTGGKLRCDFD